MLLLNIVTFDILSYFLTKLRKELSSTYISKTTSITGPVYIGVGDSLAEVYINDNLQTNVFPKSLLVACSSEYIYVIYPASNTKSIIMSINDIIIPTDSLQTTTLDGNTYFILKSSNAYNYSGKIKFSVE